MDHLKMEEPTRNEMPKMANKYLLPGLITNRIPSVHNNTFVLGLCGVDLEHAGEQDDGWFFPTFMLLTISSKAAERESRHGSQRCSPEISWTSSGLLVKVMEALVTAITPKNGNGDEDTEILIVIFGHTQHEDNSIIVDYSPYQPDPLKEIQYDRRQLSLSKIQAAVAGAIPSRGDRNPVRVTLLTPACYSGGWSVRCLSPDLITYFRGLTCSQPTDTRETSNSAEDDGDDDSDMGMFKRVFRQLINVLDNPNPLPIFHGFFFRDDKAEDRQLSRRWQQLQSVVAPSKDEELHQSNEAAKDFNKAAAPAAGSVSSDTQTSPFQIEHLFGANFSSQLRFVRKLATSHRNTCMGDWYRGWLSRHRAHLDRFIRATDEALTRHEVQSMLQWMEWRVASMDLADILVEMLDLPRPSGGLLCQLWDRRYGVGPSYGGRDEELECESSKIIHGRLRAEKFDEDVMGWANKPACRGPSRFSRPTDYLKACMALGKYTSCSEEARAIWDIKAWRQGMF